MEAVYDTLPPVLPEFDTPPPTPEAAPPATESEPAQADTPQDSQSDPPINPEASGQADALPSYKRRRTGAVACLAKVHRDKINQCLDDGFTFNQVIEAVGDV